MKTYDWPGNIRELRNLVERIVVLENAEEIKRNHLPAWILGQTQPRNGAGEGAFQLPLEGLSLDTLEKDLISQALDRTHHNKAQAAKLLGLTYDALRYQVKKFGLE